MCHLLLESHILHLAEGFRTIFFKPVESWTEELVSLKKGESNDQDGKFDIVCLLSLKKKNGGKKEMDQIPLFGCKTEQRCALYTWRINLQDCC